MNVDGGGCPVVGEVDPPSASATTGRPRPVGLFSLPQEHAPSAATCTHQMSPWARRSLRDCVVRWRCQSLLSLRLTSFFFV